MVQKSTKIHLNKVRYNMNQQKAYKSAKEC